MLSTFLFIAIFLGAKLASLMLWAWLLRIGLRWAKVPNVTTKQVIITALVTSILRLAGNLLLPLLDVSPSSPWIAIGFAEFVLSIAVPCAVIFLIFEPPLLRTVQACLPTLLALVVVTAFVSFALRPFIYESFVARTNHLAPTLVGKHWLGSCSKCGEPNYCGPRQDFNEGDPLLMICTNFHVTETSKVDTTTHAGDRFMVAKFLFPRRWDLVLFQYPNDPSALYVMRLVGLPGETVHIQDGFVWIDGKKQTPPDSIRGIEYVTEFPNFRGPDVWGSINEPAKLGDDEYFVLGDFSRNSSDSRFWEEGAPGHNPYAVPKSHIQGVVTHTYWPLDRFRIHR